MRSQAILSNSIFINFYTSQSHDTQEQHFFQFAGESTTAPLAFVQSIDDAVAAYHSRPGFSWERMRVEQAGAFDQKVKKFLFFRHCSI